MNVKMKHYIEGTDSNLIQHIEFYLKCDQENQLTSTNYWFYLVNLK